MNNDFNKENENTMNTHEDEINNPVPETESEIVPEENNVAGEETVPADEIKEDTDKDINYTYDDGGDAEPKEPLEEEKTSSFTYKGSYGESSPSEKGVGDNDVKHDTNNKRKNKKKSSGGVSGGALAVVVAMCILLSAAAGFGGAFAYDYMYETDDSSVSAVGDADSGGVLHRVVETDESTSAGVKGIYTDVAATVKDSVVEITTEFQVTGFFQYVSEGAGSGVIISKDGYIVTNNHVISDTDNGGTADTITVRLTNGNEYEAKLVGKDSDSDIAVIKIEPDEELSFAVFGDSDKLTVGEEVVAVGNPLGELGGTVTNGIISALDREINVDGTNMNLLQTNAAINPGNSGGGLFNMKGELIGVVNAKSSGSGIEGLGFAIPANDAYKVAEQLMTNGYVTGKVYLGISFYDVTDPYTAYRYFRSQATGVYVVELVEGYNDDVLKKGDRIVAVDGNEITEFSQIKDILKDHKVGDTLKFSVHRAGKLTEVDVKCFEFIPEDVNVDFGEKS